MKLELSDDLGKLWEQAGAIDQEIRQRGVTISAGLQERAPYTREALMTDALQRHITGAREAIQRHDDQRDKREQARKAVEDAEKERQGHQGEGHDDLGWYKPIPGTVSLLLALPNDSEAQRRTIVGRLRSIRKFGGIKRVVRVDEGPRNARVQYVPADEGQRDDLSLIGVVFQVRNGFALHEASATNERLASQMERESAIREQEEEARWAAYANN